MLNILRREIRSDHNASAKALLATLGDLTTEELLALTDNPEKLKDFCHSLAVETVQNTFVVPLSDKEVLDQFPQFADRLPPWRNLAAAMNYRGPVALRVEQGFTLKYHARLAGPCYNTLDYLQNWNFADNPTADSLVFWVPSLAEQIMKKTIVEMEARRSELKQLYNLPSAHCMSFGSIQLLSALILAHFKRTGERMPPNRLYAASDTLNVTGFRLVAGDFDSNGLKCNYWGGSVGGGGNRIVTDFDTSDPVESYMLGVSNEQQCHKRWSDSLKGGYIGPLGFFLLGVEELGQPANAASA